MAISLARNNIFPWDQKYQIDIDLLHQKQPKSQFMTKIHEDPLMGAKVRSWIMKCEILSPELLPSILLPYSSAGANFTPDFALDL